MAKRLHPRSPVAQRTAGITLDHAAPLYDWLAPLMTLGSEQRLHRRVVERLALDRPATVLDVGCGTGTLTRQVYDALPDTPDRRVCGVDAAEAMIEIAVQKAGPRLRLEFAAALAEDLPYPEASFDRVLSTFFFHHLNYALKVRSLAEIWRVLRPGGQAAILDVDIPYSLFGNHLRLVRILALPPGRNRRKHPRQAARSPAGIAVGRPLEPRLAPLRLPQSFYNGQTPGEHPMKNTTRFLSALMLGMLALPLAASAQVQPPTIPSATPPPPTSRSSSRISRPWPTATPRRTPSARR